MEESSKREQWLTAEEAKLLADCGISHFKASGNGGQHRNKVSTAVRLTHLPSGRTAAATDSRRQSENVHAAARKLRLAIAAAFREPFVGGDFDLVGVNPRNPRYPLWFARMLDLLHQHDYEHQAAAAALGASPSKLVRRLAADPELWTIFNRERELRGRPRLRTP